MFLPHHWLLCRLCLLLHPEIHITQRQQTIHTRRGLHVPSRALLESSVLARRAPTRVSLRTESLLILHGGAGISWRGRGIVAASRGGAGVREV